MKLFEELKTVMPNAHDRPVLAKLEKLPYLTAIILEGLRITHGVSHRIMRAFPHHALHYNGLEIPPGTSVMMTSLLLHENETIFPEPRLFQPERWLHGNRDRLERYLVAFSRGTRGCLGINLAWAEMYLVLASIFRRYDFDLSEVVRERDIDIVRDCITGAPALDSKGIIVRVLPGPE
jgi:cytochrome P450